MNNTAALNQGLQNAKKLIENHILNEIMIPIANDILMLAMTHREQNIKHNMTGNTINAYVVAVFRNGKMVWDSNSSSQLPPPLRGKLSTKEKYLAGNPRWDGDKQENTFEALIKTDKDTEITSATMSFVNTYRAISNGWEILVCNGVEYASFQEAAMGIDVLSNSFIDMQTWHKTYFKPML